MISNNTVANKTFTILLYHLCNTRILHILHKIYNNNMYITIYYTLRAFYNKHFTKWI